MICSHRLLLPIQNNEVQLTHTTCNVNEFYIEKHIYNSKV